jgi:hypothetical protein
MTSYIKIFFAIVFVTIFCSCDGDRTISDFEVPQTGSQQELNNNTKLDRSIDVVAPFNDNSTEAEKASFYETNSN